MEIRRAILLFAIVLGLAALVTSFTRPATEREEQRERTEAAPPPRAPSPTPAASPGPAAAGPKLLRFQAGAKPQTRTLEAGRAASVLVSVLAPGRVELGDFGLDATADPSTPARFEVFPTEPGRYAIDFVPANGVGGRTTGVLRVRE